MLDKGRHGDWPQEAMNRLGLVAFCGYIATIFLANWLIQHVGIINVVPLLALGL